MSEHCRVVGPFVYLDAQQLGKADETLTRAAAARLMRLCSPGSQAVKGSAPSGG